MVAGVKIGMRVEASAVKILGARAATDEFGKQAVRCLVVGTVVGVDGQGRGAKWKVKWDRPQIESSWSARTLSKETVAEETVDDEESSSRKVTVTLVPPLLRLPLFPPPLQLGCLLQPSQWTTTMETATK